MNACEDVKGSPGDVSLASGPPKSSSTSMADASSAVPVGGGGKGVARVRALPAQPRYLSPVTNAVPTVTLRPSLPFLLHTYLIRVFSYPASDRGTIAAYPNQNNGSAYVEFTPPRMRKALALATATSAYPAHAGLQPTRRTSQQSVFVRSAP